MPERGQLWPGAGRSGRTAISSRISTAGQRIIGQSRTQTDTLQRVGAAVH